VASGDTLFKIAWRFGMDYKELARINDIAAPYTIYPGQKLIFNAPVVAQPRESVAPTSPVTKPVVQASTKPRVAVKEEPPMPAFTGRWRWPAPGKIIRAYSGSVHKGIDIVGERGDPVVAVADGKVVYAGTGISGYGRLLIVKHDETYLSAYGHNDTLLVSEGDAVQGGQRIARMGDSGTDSVKLHFEMRRNGKPIDPQSLLGKR
jgi:lipoprotein NlpD